MYKCIKGFSIEKCDENGSTLDGEYATIEEGSIWELPEDENYRFIGGEIRLESDKYGWLEISKETLEENFEILEADCLACPYSKKNACTDCRRDWNDEEDN